MLGFGCSGGNGSNMFVCFELVGPGGSWPTFAVLFKLANLDGLEFPYMLVFCWATTWIWFRFCDCCWIAICYCCRWLIWSKAGNFGAVWGGFEPGAAAATGGAKLFGSVFWTVGCFFASGTWLSLSCRNGLRWGLTLSLESSKIRSIFGWIFFLPVLAFIVTFCSYLRGC